jgi:cardiolipin synthase
MTGLMTAGITGLTPTLLSPLEHSLPWLVPTLHVLVASFVSCHILLRKRETRSKIGWIGLVWLTPLLGSLLYLFLGINRIQRQATRIRRGMRRSGPSGDSICTSQQLREVLGPDHLHLLHLSRLVQKVTNRPLLAGNAIRVLHDGREAYPAMLEAIHEARKSVALSTYIFYDDPVGRRFVEALGKAVRRGVQVRVLIDDVGSRYGGLSTVIGPLRQAGVTVSTFIPTFSPTRITYFNLRNHRKILVVDGERGFTGGMNIDQMFETGRDGIHLHDLHFEVRGPVVADLQRVFVDDWEFTTREHLSGHTWFPHLPLEGETPARCVVDGPDSVEDPLLATILGGIASAQMSIGIVTPYFLPDEAMISALAVAALRGVEVDIVLPQKNNVALVRWASMPFLRRVLEDGCRVWQSPPPFDHTKLMIVDHAWAFIGSANLDPRSLRLNFEVNVECYGQRFAEIVERIFLTKKQAACPLTMRDLDMAPLYVRLRDSAASLLSPYL